MSIPAVVIGASGYVGGELLRLIAGHPTFELAAAVSGSNADQEIGSVFRNLAAAYPGTTFCALERWDQALSDGDSVAVFSAAPHGASAPVVEAILKRAQQRPLKAHVVDASADFRLLDGLGIARPEVQAPEAPKAEPVGSFVCGKTGEPGTQMGRPPFRGPIGEWIRDTISKQTFDAWIALGTKIINELRLDLSNDEHEVVYDYGMRRYLGLTNEAYQELSGREAPMPSPDYKEMIDTVLERMGEIEQFQGKMHEDLS